MEYEWDDDKNASNIRKHGVSFDLVKLVDWSEALLFDLRWEDDEERELYIVPVGNRLYAVLTTERTSATRVISVRDASTQEKNVWKREFQHG